MRARAPTAGGAAWIVTFGDLAALLLTFFVLTYSMSDIPPPRPPDLAAWSDQLGLESAIVAGDVSDRSSETDPGDNRANIYVRSLARDAVERAGLAGRASTRIVEYGVEILVRDVAWNETKVPPALAALIGRVGELSRLADRTLSVETGMGTETSITAALSRSLVLMGASAQMVVVGVRPTLVSNSVLIRLEPRA